MKTINFYSENLPIAEIDIVFRSPTPYKKLKERAVAFVLEGEKVPTVSIHDLIEMKLKAGRKQGLSEVDHLKTIAEK
jgi:predicted nucleotidyltransferase